MENVLLTLALVVLFTLIGAGIAGASVAAHLAETRSVAILEMEERPGYHTTGRSASMYEPNYGPPSMLALTRAVQIFDEVFVLTGGGPGSATTFIVQFIYQTGFAEQIQLYGLAAAASLILALGLMALTVMQLKLTRASQAGQKAK